MERKFEEMIERLEALLQQHEKNNFGFKKNNFGFKKNILVNHRCKICKGENGLQVIGDKSGAAVLTAFKCTICNHYGDYVEMVEALPAQGHWEEYTIHTEGHACGLREYCFHINDSCLGLVRAFSMVGFGGIQLENLTGWFNILCLQTEGIDSKPHAPKKVRFWVEG